MKKTGLYIALFITVAGILTALTVAAGIVWRPLAFIVLGLTSLPTVLWGTNQIDTKVFGANTADLPTTTLFRDTKDLVANARFDVEHTVKDIVGEIAGLHASEVHLEHTLATDLKLGEKDIHEVLFTVEAELRVEATTIDKATVKTVGDLVNWVKTHI